VTEPEKGGGTKRIEGFAQRRRNLDLGGGVINEIRSVRGENSLMEGYLIFFEEGPIRMSNVPGQGQETWG